MTIFAGLAIEAFGTEAARQSAPRISGLAAALTVLSGFYLGARFGVLGDWWLRASYAAIVMMIVAGAMARRRSALLPMSLRVRTVFALAVVFLMVAKPDALASFATLGVAFAAAILVGVPRKPRVSLSRA